MNRIVWTPITRAQHSREGFRFASDLTDAGWAVQEPLLPPPAETGRRQASPVREIINAILYILRGGCPWRMLPVCFPPRQTIDGWFANFPNRGVCQRLNYQLVMLDREPAGREASPSVAAIDGQSVKTTETDRPRGYEAGKRRR